MAKKTRKVAVVAADVVAVEATSPIPEVVTEPSVPTTQTSEPTTEVVVQEVIAKKNLWVYLVRARVTNSVEEPVSNYYVTAPSQCAATKFTALQPEVTDILFVRRFLDDINSEYIPEGARTLYTEEDCR